MNASSRIALAAAALACAGIAPARAQEFHAFDSRGLPGSEGVVVRVQRPSTWKQVPTDDEEALAELRGPQGALTGILQIGRGQRGENVEALCRPERARTMLQEVHEPGTFVTDVVARMYEGRPGYEIRYERHNPPTFMVVRSRVVCLKDSRLVVSCGGAGERRADVRAIEPVCGKVLESLSITED